mgnify:FL=1
MCRLACRESILRVYTALFELRRELDDPVFLQFTLRSLNLRLELDDPWQYFCRLTDSIADWWCVTIIATTTTTTTIGWCGFCVVLI